ncbi:hypothetical protein PR048_022209 [Dryococelus australis]|uniref:Uncharacterized protein n=1 Tax=Dryococelus australis TaxID=614101 RepID=A0ABQ9H0C2_9NEOP|nr:hypothetical protein PR048_022209 [Dryococelus australis]
MDQDVGRLTQTPVSPSNARKMTANPSKWEKAKEKRMSHVTVVTSNRKCPRSGVNNGKEVTTRVFFIPRLKEEKVMRVKVWMKNTENTSIYMWLENDSPKGSRQIASAVYNRLCSTDLDGIDNIRFVADGCGAKTRIRQCFIPPDRIFGRTERNMNFTSQILTPDLYEHVVKEVATVFRLGADNIPIHDWKTAVSQTVKEPSSWNIKFKPCKRVLIEKMGSTGTTVQGETAYNVDTGGGRSIFRREKSWHNVEPSPLQVQDISKLLTTHFGEAREKREHLELYAHLIS